MHVVFFDIDGTLIHSGGAGMTALRRAFAETFARPEPGDINTVGRTDRGIAGELFRQHAIEDSWEHWQQFHTAYLRHLTTQLPLREGRILPGVVALLEELAVRRHVALGLLTGNTAAGARIKLEHFGLYHHFAFGGYGEDHPEREAVAQAALGAAQAFLRTSLTPDRAWVIGDTNLDVRCARHIGAKAVAVASGFQPKQDLIDATPDLLFDDLRQCGPLLDLLDDGA